MSALFENMAFRGDWKPLFDFIANAVREQSRIREYIEGEAHIKGFLLAYLGMYRYYQLYPEYELNKRALQISSSNLVCRFPYFLLSPICLR